MSSQQTIDALVAKGSFAKTVLLCNEMLMFRTVDAIADMMLPDSTLSLKQSGDVTFLLEKLQSGASLNHSVYCILELGAST